MRKLLSRRLFMLLVVGVAASFAVAGIALAAAKDNQPAPAGPLLLQLGGTPQPGTLSVLSYSWGISNPASKGKAGAVSASPFNFNRSADSSSSTLLAAVTTGTVFSKVDFTATVHNGATTTTIAYELLNAQIISEQQSASSEDASESFSIGAYSKVSWTITDSSGTTTGSFTP
jgi:type VI protein secretion system component Hcp